MSRWLTFALALLPLFAAAEQTLTLGIFAYRPPAIMATKYDLLADYLSAATPGYRIRILYLDPPAMEAALADQQLDFVFTNPGHFVQLRHANRLSGAIATQQALDNGLATASLGGVIIVPSDSPIQSITDLRSKRVAVPGTKFLGGYQTQAYELWLAGLRLPGDIVQLEFGSHDTVIDRVLAGEADAGFIRTGLIESRRREGTLPDGRLRIINPQHYPDFPWMVSTRLYPEWAFAALPRVPEAIVKQVNLALLKITPEMPVAQAAGIHGFTIPGDYQAVESLARNLRLPPYEQADFSIADVWQRYRWTLLSAALAIAVIVALALRLAVSRRQLHDTLRRLQNIADRVPGVVFEYRGRSNDVGHFAYASDALRELCGLEPAAVNADGKAFFARVLAEDQPVLRETLRQSGEELAPWQHEFRLVRPDGEVRWLAGNALPQRQSDGSLVWHGYLADITPRKATEAELEKHRHHLEHLVEVRTADLLLAKDAAEAASRAKSAFLANMSHELRTPMNAIIGMNQIALRRATDDRLRHQLGTVSEAANHLLGLITNILEISRLESSDPLLQSSRFNLRTLVSGVLPPHAENAAVKGLQLHAVLPDEIAEQPLQGAAGALEKVIHNLLGNAIKFTASGSVSLQVSRLNETAENLRLRCEIHDTGIGISNEAKQRLFSHFEQADNSSTRQFGGVGLGLALSKRLLQLIGSDIGVDSTPGIGSCFWFAVDLEKAPETTTAAQAV